MRVHQTLAVLFPGAEKREVAAASAKYNITVAQTEPYSMQKDYEKYFKPSWHIFHNDEVDLLFVFADGGAELVTDANSLKQAMERAGVGMLQVA